MKHKEQKMIYILNHYSRHTEQHFLHVINLLEKIAELGVQIALVIEKCDERPVLKNLNIKVLAQQRKSAIGRITELFGILQKLKKEGYKKSFVRISTGAACISILSGFFSNLKTYYWLSGQGSVENYNELRWGRNKLKLFFTFRMPFWFIKTFVYRFVTGPESMGRYMEKIMGVSNRKIMILFNDINISRFSKVNEPERISNKKSLGLPSDKKIILFVHRLSPMRRTLYYIPFIINEFFKTRLAEDYHFAFAGSGPEYHELKKAIKNANVMHCITLLGAIPNANIDKLYKAADIFINPTYAEGFPRVLLEAMSCGLPLVTTDAGGITDMLGDKQQAYMVGKDDRILFAQKLIELATNNKEQELLREENLNHVQQYSTENVAKMYINRIFSRV